PPTPLSAHGKGLHIQLVEKEVHEDIHQSLETCLGCFFCRPGPRKAPRSNDDPRIRISE
ncbi:hypothetical protein M378DRAFT_163543, partial [Amanita muscaria Koide BX008]